MVYNIYNKLVATQLIWETAQTRKPGLGAEKLDPPIEAFSLHDNGNTIRIGREIQCLPHAGFFLLP